VQGLDVHAQHFRGLSYLTNERHIMNITRFHTVMATSFSPPFFTLESVAPLQGSR
jgi:hypothetical protein